jgi:MarR family transcriptional regulator for hemolysin
MRPDPLPIGLQLARTARLVGRAFDEALAEAEGSVPVWLVLLNLKIRPSASQRELAEAIGVREATLTHHLNAMERDGLLTRRRHEHNRRVHVVELTETGEATFAKLAAAASGFDQRLRQGFGKQELAELGRLLQQLVANVDTGQDASAPWAGLLDGAP